MDEPMTAEVRALPTAQLIASKGVIDILRELVVRAEKGEIRAVAISAILADGLPASFISPTAELTKMVGAAALTQLQLMQLGMGMGRAVPPTPPEGTT
jgi:hypothetical protein